MNSLFLLQLVQDTTATTAASTGVEQNFKEVSVWHAVAESMSSISGFVIMMLLFLMSIYVVYLLVERYLALRRAQKNNPRFLSELKLYLSDGKFDEAKNLCVRTNSPSSRMLEKGIDRLGKPIDVISSAIDNSGKLEVSRLEQRLSFLGTASSAGPMLGFLGTTTGMVHAFNVMSAMDFLTLSTIAPGIMEAMITTVTGLIVGIIAYMGYNHLVNQISKVVYQMELDAMEFMDVLHKPVK
ncbi:MAG TPA: MotA/TolQ/ExbB proton channel family protein [Arachidicoccus soli]|nr:MotA/TolQ/ExbB proton channel family protein [Arachidicoccus soli]